MIPPTTLDKLTDDELTALAKKHARRGNLATCHVLAAADERDAYDEAGDYAAGDLAAVRLAYWMRVDARHQRARNQVEAERKARAAPEEQP